MNEAICILKKAYDNGINYYDTARAYTDSEEKIGNALSSVRSNIIIATKTQARDKKTMQQHLEKSLKKLKTDYIDVYQLHNPPEMPERGDSNSFTALCSRPASSGVIRFIGITNHRRTVALEAIQSSICSIRLSIP